MTNANDGSGCATGFLTFALLVAISTMIVALTGVPNIAQIGLSWNTEAHADRQATERLRIQEEQQTERLRVQENAAISRTILLVAACLGVVALAGHVTMTVARETSKRPTIVVQQYQLSNHRRLYLSDHGDSIHSIHSKPERPESWRGDE